MNAVVCDIVHVVLIGVASFNRPRPPEIRNHNRPKYTEFARDACCMICMRIEIIQSIFHGRAWLTVGGSLTTLTYLYTYIHIILLLYIRMTAVYICVQKYDNMYMSDR